LLCHYCEYWRSVPKVCPKCDSEHIYFMGEGTERIEDLLTQQFPKARIGRLDRDTVRGRDQFEGILQQFRDGRYDVLVGTQMIAKGHDIHNVTLVGVISADTALGLPDFRAAERTFQLLTQVAGRAGRGTRPGRVILQTYSPEHYAIQMAAAQDYEAFYEKELRFRRVMHYPPFTALAAILIRHERLEEALKISAVLSQRIADGKWEGVRVLGPAAAPLLRLKKEFRYQFLIKSQRRDVLNTLLRDLRACARAENLPSTAMVFDADPLSLM
jgi:primosomal protein N' (replication factor Y) (superfamily II helicase)